ncbi:hypothetical protein M5E86_04630 [Blautia wexlerae]|nr:hypothetical protein M5E86_04630 [Blautia wexlerae]
MIIEEIYAGVAISTIYLKVQREDNASMDTDKIIQDLNRRFAVFLPEFYQRRIIFWYDEDKEFEDKLDEVVLENAKVIELTGNNVFCRNLYEARRTNEYVQS